MCYVGAAMSTCHHHAEGRGLERAGVQRQVGQEVREQGGVREEQGNREGEEESAACHAGVGYWPGPAESSAGGS